MSEKRKAPQQSLASTATSGNNPGSEQEDSEDDLPVIRMSKKRRLKLKQHSPTSTAWDAVTTEYPAEIDQFFPSQDSIPQSLSIVKYLAKLPAVPGSLDYNDHRIGSMSFTLELGSKGAVKAQGNYDHFHSRNRVSRSQGNLKAVLAQASGTPAPVPCERCARNRGLWKTCMKAATMQNINKSDTLGGSCPSCYYNGAGHICSNRNPPAENKKAQASSSKVNMAQTPYPSIEDGEPSSQATQATKQTSQAPVESPAVPSSSSRRQTMNKHNPALATVDHARVQASLASTPVAEPHNAHLFQLQRLMTENQHFRAEIEKLQAKVEELEDMIEAEERQAGY